jgi:hypothetical protein
MTLFQDFVAAKVALLDLSISFLDWLVYMLAL